MKVSLIEQRRKLAASAPKPAIKVDPMARATAAIATCNAPVNAQVLALSNQPKINGPVAATTRAAYQKQLDASSKRILSILTTKYTPALATKSPVAQRLGSILRPLKAVFWKD